MHQLTQRNKQMTSKIVDTNILHKSYDHEVYNIILKLMFSLLSCSDTSLHNW